MTKKRVKRFWHSGNLIAVSAVLAIGGLGSAFLAASFAATANNNPSGFADSCALVGNTTVLYGWAYDPNAAATAQPYVNVTVGNSTQQQPTSISGYRTAVINNSLSTSYPGRSQNGVYGWKASYTALYKGGSYRVTGVILNYGSGADTALSINTTRYVDGDTSKPYFTGGLIPNACLATNPATVPTPTPVPAPKPTPIPTPVPAPVIKPPVAETPVATTPKKTVTKPASAAATPAAPTVVAPANTADATVKPGTLGASFSVPADGATALHIAYGTAADQLKQATPDSTPAGDSVAIALDKLTAHTTYYYQLVRSNAGGTVTSGTANFTTKGYSISVAFQDANGKPVSGIKGQIVGDNKTAISGSDGLMTFDDLPGGSYDINFTYANQKHTLTYDTSSLSDAGSPDQTAVLNDSIDLSQFNKTAARQSSGGHPVVVVIVSLLFLSLLTAGLIWFLRRRRRAADELPAYPAPVSVPALPGQTPQPYGQPVPITAVPPPAVMTSNLPPELTSGHESLRDMVIKSMHQQAASRAVPSPAPVPLPTTYPPPAAAEQPLPVLPSKPEVRPWEPPSHHTMIK